MPRSPDTSAVVHRRFDDFDELAVAARHWDLDFMQLDGGPFRGEMVQAVAGGVLFSEARFGRALKQQGSAPRGMRTFVVPAVRDVRFRWRRKDVGPNDLLVFPRNGELHAASQPDFAVFTISLPESLLDETAEFAGVPNLQEILRREKMPGRPPMIELLRKRLRAVSRAAKEPAQQEARSAMLSALRLEIPSLLITALAATGMSTNDLTGRKRDHAIRRAEDYISQFEDRPITVREVCRAAQVSERTLQYAFLEQFGVTPKAYLKAVRLNGVRRDLKRAGPNGSSIREIAGRWGFWHTGQFAADYRGQFGELPSQTVSS